MKICVRNQKLLAVIITSMLVMTGDTFAATYYVDKAIGKDTNTGTEAAPWLTIQKGVNQAVAGDTVYVKAGVYTERLTMQRSGASGAYISFRAYPNHVVAIDGTGIAVDKFIDWKGSPSGGVDKHYIRFNGFIVRNVRRWAFWIEGNYNVIENCRIYNCGPTNSGVAILVRQGNYTLISSNDVYNCGWNGINAENSNFTTIQFNRSHDNPSHFGINVFPNTGGTQVMQTNNNIICNILYNNMGGIYTRYQRDNLIAGNVIYGSKENGIFFHVHGTGPQQYMSGTKIYNNTIVGNTFHAIQNIGATHLVIRNNILVNHATINKYYEIFIDAGDTVGHTMDNNLYWPNATQLIYWGGTKYSLAQMRSVLGFEANGIAADPLFVNLAGADYRLGTSSPAIDAGANLASAGVTVDLNLTRRPQGAGFDLGAYETAGTVSIAPPQPPTNLRTVE